jgi:hypothetical protein
MRNKLKNLVVPVLIAVVVVLYAVIVIYLMCNIFPCQ